MIIQTGLSWSSERLFQFSKMLQYQVPGTAKFGLLSARRKIQCVL